MLTGKVCFITGSTRGIGWAIARTFAANKGIVVVNGRTDETAGSKARELAAEFGTEAIGIGADAGDDMAVGKAYQAIFARFKRLDVLVNNAGVMLDGFLGMIPVATIRDTFAVNAVGPILHLQAASRLMGRAGKGSIINMSSILGRVGGEGQVVYSASKAALIGMTSAAAKELAPKGIRVNAVAPGFIETELTGHIAGERREAVVRSIRMGRAGQPEDVAAAALFFASDASSYITGQVLGVDGGMLI